MTPPVRALAKAPASWIFRSRALSSGADPGRLLGPEIELAGFLFESQVIHDLRVYAGPHRGSVLFYAGSCADLLSVVRELPGHHTRAGGGL